jgi:hypothetical protein
MRVYEFKRHDGVFGYAGCPDGRNLPTEWGPWAFEPALDIDVGAGERTDRIYGGVGERGFRVEFEDKNDAKGS